MSDNTPAEPKSVFVISPIGSTGTPEYRRYRNTLEYIVKKAFHAPEWAVVRADEETSPDSITTQVIGRIVESDLIIADLTDHNPNVFYELAVAHGYQKQVIHMMQSGQKVPFDVVDQRVIFYDLTDPESVDKARGGLIASAEWLKANPGQTRNPLSAYGQFSVIKTASGGGEEGEAVAGAIENLSRQVARLEARMPRVDTSASFSGSGGLSADGLTLKRRYKSEKDAWNTYQLLQAELVRLMTTEEQGDAQAHLTLDILREMQALHAQYPLLKKPEPPKDE